MTDVKIENGDAVSESTGQSVMIFDTGALFQRAEICIAAKMGSFIYDRNLGSLVRNVEQNGENAKEKAELVINEALAEFENTRAEVTEYGGTLKFILTINGESRNTEVHLNGNV